MSGSKTLPTAAVKLKIDAKEVEKATMTEMEEWRQKYPEAFNKEYDPASGLRFNAWVEGGMD